MPCSASSASSKCTWPSATPPRKRPKHFWCEGTSRLTGVFPSTWGQLGEACGQSRLGRARGETRTRDLPLTRRVLYRLSYSGVPHSVGSPADGGCLTLPAAGGRLPGMALSDRERAILDFERTWWAEPGPKELAIRDRFQLSATRYYQVLNALLESQEAIEYDPLVVRRLRRLRDRRRRARFEGRSADQPR